MGDLGRSLASQGGSVSRQLDLANFSILSLYLNYAFLYTTSPGCLAHESVWTELARDPEGYALLERSRDAGFAVIQAVCSVGRPLSLC